MQKWKLAAIAGAVVASSISAVLMLTNPDDEAYEEFAAEQVVGYATTKVCAKAPIFLAGRCEALVQSNQQQIQQVISNKTTRINLLLLSIYVTDLSFSPYLPAYEFKTIGVFKKFYIVQAQEA